MTDLVEETKKNSSSYEVNNNEGDPKGNLSRFLISVTDLVEETKNMEESQESTSVEDKPMDMKGFYN